MFDLGGKTALVTGASGGIGGAIAQALHGAGATVLLAGTRRDPLDALAASLGERAFVATADLADPAAPDALMQAADAAMGRGTAMRPATGSSCPADATSIAGGPAHGTDCLPGGRS